MARSYRRVDQAEAYLLRAKGILDEVDSAAPMSAWYAIGLLTGCVEEALGCLAGPASETGVEAYTRGADLMRGYVQDALFPEATSGC